MLNAPMHGIAFDGLSWQPVAIDRGGSQFEISMTVNAQVERAIVIEYNTELFDRSTIERLIERYLHLLACAVTEPSTKLSALDLMPATERRMLLDDWNATSVPLPRETFIEMFAAQAAASPNRIAVSFDGEALSYGRLEARATALAVRLAQYGASRGTMVGICVERSLDMLIALLAVQKTGAAYVPLDPRLPKARIAYMMSDSGLQLVVASEQALDGVDLPPGVTLIDAAACDADERPQPTSTSLAAPLPSDPAYVMYTSGSTGKPKGVVISHAALANFLRSMRREPGLGTGDVLAAVTTISFDIAGLELYLPLVTGARIELVSSATAADGAALAKLLQSSGASVMQATPATWRMLMDAGWKGGRGFRALCGGEAMTRELADGLLARADEVWNLYGPTETTIWSTVCRVTRDDQQISVGRPIDNTRIYILNGSTPAPAGIPGEICIGGEGVAIGYHARPELTAGRFQPDPFVAGGRIYRTGDLGRWGSDGRLYHMGRMDYQVKVRGYRIELGEIEAVLDGHPAVRKSVVVAREVGAADTRLVAYLDHDTHAAPTVSEIRLYLRKQLPDYMIPSMIVALDRLPLTPNGKIDRNALPDPFTGAGPSGALPEAVDAPADRFETMLLQLWTAALKLDRVRPDDNFFDLGGHSLLAVRVVADIEKQTGVRLDPRVLFLQSLRQIAASLSETAGGRR